MPELVEITKSDARRMGEKLAKLHEKLDFASVLRTNKARDYLKKLAGQSPARGSVLIASFHEGVVRGITKKVKPATHAK